MKVQCDIFNIIEDSVWSVRLVMGERINTMNRNIHNTLVKQGDQERERFEIVIEYNIV